jgi:hypothetical protein
MLAAFEHKVPAPLRGLFERMPSGMERLARLYARRDRELAWMLSNAMWTFGTKSLAQLIERLRAFDEAARTDRIDTHVLALVAEEERFFEKPLAYDFVERLSSARSRRLREFRREEGGHLHCRNGAIHLAHEEIFDWIRTAVLSDTSFLAERPYVTSSPVART